MTFDFKAMMREASELTAAQRLTEATEVIQRALSGTYPASASSDAPLLDPPASAQQEAAPPPRPARRPRRPLGEVLSLLKKANPGGAQPFVRPQGAPRVEVPDGAAWLLRSFSCEAGSRDAMVYVPAKAREGRAPLVVMLHGCTQNPDDFAVGTGMNRLADAQGFVVAYARQPASANPQACWNWFNPADQQRGAGEPRLIAGLTQAIVEEFNIDPHRVYVAGLSAGGAMAAVMGAAYPDLYAAAGVHSGLAHESASDVASALAAMRGASGQGARGRRRSAGRGSSVRTIVFHGAADNTVHPSNADAILAQARASLAGPIQETQHDGAAGGRAYTRTILAAGSDPARAEVWAVEGLGHAWSGGNAGGSYADPRGPDASREMLRFFLEDAPAG